MNTLEKIRQTGASIALQSGIIGTPRIEDVNLSNKLIEEYIRKVIRDLLEFNTKEGFDPEYFNLFSRAFMYVFGKGLEVTFFARLKKSISFINYDFDKLMKGTCGEYLPEKIKLSAYKYTSNIMDMYIEMFKNVKGAGEKIISEGLTFEECLNTILNGAFYYGKELCLRIPFDKQEKVEIYFLEKDNSYDYDRYEKNKYSLEDFKIVNYTFL